MQPDQITSLLPDAKAAAGAFLETILGQPVVLDVGPPEPVETDSLYDRKAGCLALLGRPRGSANPHFIVLLDNSWLPQLSAAVIGEAVASFDETAGDLLRELAAQCYGALSASLTVSGTTLSECSFQAVKTLAEVPLEALAACPVHLPVSMQVAGAVLQGALLMGTVRPAAARMAAGPAATGAAPKRVTPAASAFPVPISPASFPDFGGESLGEDNQQNFDLLVDVELEITVELGRRKMPLADVLRLANGSIIELEKLAGESLEVYANGRLIAEGEVVVIDDQFGIRVTRLASAHQSQKKRAYF